jgi:hypothetical protein
MPPVPRRASSLYFSSSVIPTSGSFAGPSIATVASACKAAPSSGHTLTSSAKS